MVGRNHRDFCTSGGVGWGCDAGGSVVSEAAVTGIARKACGTHGHDQSQFFLTDRCRKWTLPIYLRGRQGKKKGGRPCKRKL